jgi:hypothetical protein
LHPSVPSVNMIVVYHLPLDSRIHHAPRSVHGVTLIGVLDLQPAGCSYLNEWHANSCNVVHVNPLYVIKWAWTTRAR